MTFRFRRSARLGPLRFHFSKEGLSSISLGGPGASFNLPVARRGGPRATVGLPGTGMSWRLEPGPAAADRPVPNPTDPAVGLPNNRHLRAGELDALKRSCLKLLLEQLFGPWATGRRLWEENLVSRLLGDPSLGSRTMDLLRVIENEPAMASYLQRAQSQDDLKRRAHRCVEALQRAQKLAEDRGWLRP